MSNKTYGLNKEREFKKKLLEEYKAMYVIKSAGSHGFFDLIAFFKDQVHFYQIKATKQKTAYFTAELQKLKDLDVPSNAKKFLAIYWSPNKDRKKTGWEILEVE